MPGKIQESPEKWRNRSCPQTESLNIIKLSVLFKIFLRINMCIYDLPFKKELIRNQYVPFQNLNRLFFIKIGNLFKVLYVSARIQNDPKL